MSLQLLACSICPRQSEFSDISHLLTHISSKGHLAQLHKLQVRSHQEIAAGVQLANYNQWYQQHGLAQLLSERMLMKEVKKASKRTQNGIIKKDNKDVKNGTNVEANSDQSSPARQVTRNRARNKAKRAKRLLTVNENGSDLDYSPIQGLRRLQRVSYLITPVKRIPLPSSPPPGDDFLEIDPALVSPPNTKLKGTIWPGMDLFDSATPGEARRRNQRKDGSVVKNMERLSKLVEPTEAVYTMDGTLRKQRHIDDLEDNSSLIEGETPVIKSKPRQRKKPLARVSGNVPRLIQRKAKATRARPARRVVGQNGLPNIVRLPSSSARPAHCLQTQYSPTEEENVEFQLAVGNLPLRKRAGTFAIFTDSPTAYPPSMSSFPGQPMLPDHTYTVPTPQRLILPGQAWLRPQNQNQNPLYMDNKFSYAPIYPDFSLFRDMGADKENIMPGPGSMETHTANPLTWRSPMPDKPVQDHSSDSTFGSLPGYFGATTSLLDPFGYAKNPLADAFGHFAATTNMDPAKCDEKSIENPISDDNTQQQTALPAAGE